MAEARIRLGIYDNNADTPRAVWVTQAAYREFLVRLRTTLASPDASKDSLRSEVRRLVGAKFDRETYEWVMQVCTEGAVGFGTPNKAEQTRLTGLLRAELL